MKLIKSIAAFFIIIIQVQSNNSLYFYFFSKQLLFHEGKSNNINNLHFHCIINITICSLISSIFFLCYKQLLLPLLLPLLFIVRHYNMVRGFCLSSYLYINYEPQQLILWEGFLVAYWYCVS